MLRMMGGATHSLMKVVTFASFLATLVGVNGAFVAPFGMRRMSTGTTRTRAISWRPRMALPLHTNNKVHGYSFDSDEGGRKPNTDSHCVWPRILVVSRRHLRKGKFVDFVGEYHIDLLQDFGAAPILLPRTMKTLDQLDAFTLGGIDGILLMEGADIGEDYKPFGEEGPDLAEEELVAIASKFASDTEIDEAKLLNVAMGGALYCDVSAEVGGDVTHMDYDNYDGHRHPISVVPDTPLAEWFPEAFEGAEEGAPGHLSVNSYHHQGVKRLAPGLAPLCYSPDGLVEGFYDPAHTNPAQGKFRVGLQWHPERMLGDYAGCRKVYGAFVRAAAAHRRKTLKAQQAEAHRNAVYQAKQRRFGMKKSARGMVLKTRERNEEERERELVTA